MLVNAKRLAAGKLVQTAILAFVLALLSSPGRAEDWKTYQFGEVSIEAPAGWQITYRQVGREVQLASPDGVYALLAFWWLPDEPLLGYADIVAHEEFTLAGRRAMLITSDFPQRAVYGLAFLDPRANGDQFVMNLEFGDKDFAKAAVLIDQLLERLRYGGKQGGASKRFAEDRPKHGAAIAARDAAAAPDAGPETPIVAERQGQPAYVPVGDIQIAAIDDKGAVRNGPNKPVVIKSPEPIFVRSIQTYHWNNGRGRKPGTISIRSAGGDTYGPWRAIGKPGQGGVRNAYWYVEPGVVLPAGSYVLVDSDPKTWATNEAAGNKGFVRIEFQKVRVVAAAPEPVAPDTSEEGSGPDAQVEEPQAPAAVAAPQAEPPALDSWRSPEKQTLFDGTDSKLFVHHSAAGGNFDRDARFADGALVVDVHEGAGWGKVGLLSPDPLVWLDDFTGDAEVTVTYRIDPARSTGFVLALVQPGWGGVGGNDPSAPNVAFAWFKTPDGKSRAEFHVSPHNQGDFWSLIGDQTAPATVSFTLRPGEITMAAEGYERITKPWAVAADGVALRVWAYAQAAEANLPVTFALAAISVDRRYPAAPPADAAASSVEPLPMETVFDGTMGEAWEPAQVAGGNFAKFARFEDGALMVDAPEGNSWAKTGLLSTEPLVALDHRVTMTPTRLAVTLDPAKQENLVIALSPDKVAEMWLDHAVWFTLSYVPDRHGWVMGVQYSGYQDWSRLIDPAWMQAHWDGRIWLDVGAGWSTMRLPGGPAVRGAVVTSENGAYYATVLGHAPAENKAVSLTLKRIERGLVTPAGMTAADRWALVDDGDFDPDTFLGEIAGTER